MNSIDPLGAAASCGMGRVPQRWVAASRTGAMGALVPCFMAAMLAAGAAAAAGSAADTQAAPGSPATAAMPAAQAQPAWPESDTVLDLLRADARAAAAQRLGRAQDWLPPSSPAQGPARASVPGPSGRDADSVDVLAIYGVGRALHADVSVNGAVWRYRQGRHWPLGVAGQNGEPRYALIAIDLPCVRLRRQDDVRTVCLHGEQAHD